MENSELYNKIKDKYSIDAMRDIWIEELNELAVALAHHKRGKCYPVDVFHEIADVLICIEQMMVIYGYDQAIIDKRKKYVLSQLPKKLKLE